MTQNAKDYEQMAKVIQYLCQHYSDQPSLEKLARIAGLSQHHFHRKFANWVGVTPKSFLQYMIYDNAKQMLGEGRSVLDVTNELGFSSPSRLHDLCVTLDAASPGEIKSGGAGLVISYGYGFTPFGECFIAASSRGVMQLVFIGQNERDAAVVNLQNEWSGAVLKYDAQLAAIIIDQLFNHDNETQSLRAYVKATKFQIRVWRALLAVPPGRLISYGQLAESIGQPSASRAVGSAVGKNPIACLIPCHRVIRGTGLFGEYRWGQNRKQLMIAIESI